MNEKIPKIKELREKTGLGMITCKRMLELNNYEVEEAIKYIRLVHINDFNCYLPTYSENGIRIIHEFTRLFDSKINSGITAYAACVEIKEENPILFEEYINLK